MNDLSKEIKREEIKVEKAFQKSGFNLWMVLSAILLVALILVLVWPKGSASAMSGQAAGEKLTNFLNDNVVPDKGVVYKSYTDAGSLYQVNVTYNGQEIPVYVTKDGKYFIQGAMPMDAKKTGNSSASASSASATPTPTQVTKSDKPKVQAFVFSYCPYGLQFEKALLPVYDLLKNKADINIVFIGAMHGEFEKIESLRQLCIQKNYGKDGLWIYLNKFMVNTTIGSCSGDAACLAPYLSNIMKTSNIDESKITACMSKDAEALYAADGQIASSLGISGSPGFVINGAEVQVGRTPDAIKSAICDAFTTAPAECSQTLSTAAVSPSFGPAASSGSSAAAASCG